VQRRGLDELGTVSGDREDAHRARR
jgi:hypothetical protein